MKRRLCLILTALLLTAALAGCNATDPAAEKMTDGVIADKELVKVERINGRCYVDLKGRSYGGGDLIYLDTVSYPSVEAMRQALLTGEIDHFDYGNYYVFADDSQGGNRVPDPYDVYVPDVPYYYSWGNIVLTSGGYYYDLKWANSSEKIATIKVLFPEGFARRADAFINCGEHIYNLTSVKRDEARNADVYYYGSSKTSYKKVRYDLTHQGKKIYVMEDYDLSEEIPLITHILVNDDGLLYEVTVNKHTTGHLTQEDIFSFSVKPYDYQ